MDSPQSIVSPLKTSSLFPESEKQQNEKPVQNHDVASRENNFQENEKSTQNNLEEKEESPIGALEVYIDQARDIHNICIYQKQDVYAKLSLTCDPEKTVSTKIINGGGRNPIFNETLRLNVGKVDASLKCEIWMLSRVRNYLEDQLLGFALVPVSEILLHNGKLEREFSLSSTDLFHSPAGFVQLSVTYLGTHPEVIPLTAPVSSVETANQLVSENESIKLIPGDLDKIEFPDPRVVNENQSMVEEYFAMPCPDVESNSSESAVNSEITENKDADSSLKVDSPPSIVSTSEASSASNPVSFESHETTPKDLESPGEKNASKPEDGVKANGNDDAFVKQSIVTVNIEQEPKVVQQDIVDMYMKSMQQFTESLAKMKLPMDANSGPASSDNSSSDQKADGSAKNSGSRVFYGSRAFF